MDLWLSSELYALARAFAPEFTRLQLIVGEDLNTSLRGLMVDLKRTTSDLIRDLDIACRNTAGLSSTNPSVGLAVDRFHRAVQMKMALPLLQLDSAHEDMEKFLQSCLSEPHAHKELTSLLTCLVDKLNSHEQRLQDLVMEQSLDDPDVALRVLVGLGAYQPIDTKLFPGIMEGILGSLGIDAASKGNPPASSKEGVARKWATTVQEAIWRMEGKDTSLEVVPGMPSGLHLGYEDDFLRRWTADISRVFTDPELLMKIAHAVYDWAKPSPERSQRFSYAEDPEEAPGGTGPNTSHSTPPMEVPSGTATPGTSQPPSPAKVLDESDTDSMDTTGSGDQDQPQTRVSSARSERLQSLRKRHRVASVGSEEGAPSEKRTSASQEASCPEGLTATRISEEVLKSHRFTLYDKDHKAAQQVRALIIGLGDKPKLSQADIDSSPVYELRRAADDSGSPAVIGQHWIPHLEKEGYLASCPPKETPLKDRWLPLYTRDSVL